MTESLIERLRAGKLIQVEEQPAVTLIDTDGNEHQIGPSTVETRQQCPLCLEAADALSSLTDEGAPWQPIETAPKGTPLILFARAKNASASAVVIGWHIDELGWIECCFTPNRPVGIVPSHWMPRPPFPAISAVGTTGAMSDDNG